MRVILVQHKVAQVLQGENNLPSTMIKTQKTNILKTTYSTIILYLNDSVLRKCNKETTAVGLWLKFESLYDKISHELDLFDGETIWV